MRKNTVWKMDEQGNLEFPLRSGQLQDAYKPESFWELPGVSLFTLILCALMDFVVFKQLFGLILYDQVWIQWLSVAGCLIAFDFGPVYLGISRRRSTQGLKVDKLGAALLLTAFFAVLVFNCFLRVTVKDQLVPSNSAALFSIFSGMGGNSGSDPASLPYAIFSSILPVATSVVSFYVSLISCNPLKSRLKRLHKQQLELEDAVCKLNGILAEYKTSEGLEIRLNTEDNMLYASALALAKEQGIFLADYVRERLKEHLGDEASLNELSGDIRSRMEELFSPVNQEDKPKIIKIADTKEAV